MKINNQIKKIVALFIILTLICSLVGCGEKVSEQHLAYGKKAVEIADQYLNYEISADEAYDLLGELREREDELPDTEYTDPTHSNNQHIEFYVSFLELDFLGYDSSAEEYQDVIEDRDAIAEIVGIKRIQKKSKKEADTVDDADTASSVITDDESNEIEQTITDALLVYDVKFVIVSDYDGTVNISINLQNPSAIWFQASCEKCVEVVQDVYDNYDLPFGDLDITLVRGNNSCIYWRTEDLKTGILIDTENQLCLNVDVNEIQSSLKN